MDTPSTPGERAGEQTVAESLLVADFLALPQTHVAGQPPQEPNPGGVLTSWITSAQMGNVEVYALHMGTATAIVSRFGAQVLAYRPAEGTDVLFTSSAATFDGLTPIRGGIPICWPWFGTEQQPRHGWGRLQDWELIEATAGGELAELLFRIEVDGAAAEVRISLGFKLVVTLTHLADPRSEGSDAQAERVDLSAPPDVQLAEQARLVDSAPDISAALHSYLLVKQAAGTVVSGLPDEFAFPAAGVDSVWRLPEAADRCTLRIDSGPSPDDEDAAWRPISLSAVCSDIVLWNPAQGLDDTTPQAHERFVCVEPARISKRLRPGDTLTASYGQAPA